VLALAPLDGCATSPVSVVGARGEVVAMGGRFGDFRAAVDSCRVTDHGVELIDSRAERLPRVRLYWGKAWEAFMPFGVERSAETVARQEDTRSMLTIWIYTRVHDGWAAETDVRSNELTCADFVGHMNTWLTERTARLEESGSLRFRCSTAAGDFAGRVSFRCLR
jgi:hypothetical protein